MSSYPLDCWLSRPRRQRRRFAPARQFSLAKFDDHLVPIGQAPAVVGSFVYLDSNQDAAASENGVCVFTTTGSGIHWFAILNPCTYRTNQVQPVRLADADGANDRSTIQRPGDRRWPSAG